MPGPQPPGRLVLTGNGQSPSGLAGSASSPERGAFCGLCPRGVEDAAPYNAILQTQYNKSTC